MWTEPKPGRRAPGARGAALLAVLWLSAALAAIAYSVATTVRVELDRASTNVDGVKAHYLAAGAIDRTILYMLWGPNEKAPDGSARYWRQGMPRVYHRFPSGDALVEVIPATAKLNVNTATGEQLLRLLLALGAEPPRARMITAALLDWRQPAPAGPSPFDHQYMSRPPSFRGRHASLEEIEEVLLVQGMTPELFYGTYDRAPDGRLVRRSGFRDCATVYGTHSMFDVNGADPALLRSLDVPEHAIAQIVAIRQRQPILPEDLNQVRQLAGPAGSRLGTGGNSIFTLRATARLRLQDGSLSDLRRSVAAEVKFFGYGFQPPYHVLRWYDHAPVDTLLWP